MPPNEETADSPQADLQQGVVFGPHIVALIDFLGQSSELAKWDFYPDTDGKMAEWLLAVARSRTLLANARPTSMICESCGT